MRIGHIHAAPLDSPRLSGALHALRQAGETGLTSRELAEAAGALSPNTVAAELRAHGLVVDCRFVRRTASGARVYAYRLRERVKQIEML